ncbi:MAG: hypothetical protein R3E50_09960 [Halioglobus sp.]
MLVGTGIICLAVGGNLTITGAAELAHILGLPPVIVGMVIVAIGHQPARTGYVGNRGVQGRSRTVSGQRDRIQSLQQPLRAPDQRRDPPSANTRRWDNGYPGDAGVQRSAAAGLFFGSATMSRKTALGMIAAYCVYMTVRAVG